MKVLLIEDVDKIGWLGDVVEVADGYARNYLLSQGKAKPATEENLRSIAQQKAKRARQRIAQHKRMEEAAKAVEGAEAVIAARANEQGHLFGSVSASQIADNLRQQGYEVADQIVRLTEHIKQVGTHQVTLRFAEDLAVTVSVVVVAEKPEADGSALRTQQDKESGTSEEH